MAPVLLTVPEVAERLRLSRNSVYLRFRTGELRYVKRGPKGHIRVDEDELNDYLRRSTTPAVSKESA